MSGVLSESPTGGTSTDFAGSTVLDGSTRLDGSAGGRQVHQDAVVLPKVETDAKLGIVTRLQAENERLRELFDIMFCGLVGNEARRSAFDFHQLQHKGASIGDDDHERLKVCFPLCTLLGQRAYDAVQQELVKERRLREDLEAKIIIVQEDLVQQRHLAVERLVNLNASCCTMEELQAALSEAQRNLEIHRRASEESLREACDHLISEHQEMRKRLESEHFASERLWQERCDLLELAYEEVKRKREREIETIEGLQHDLSLARRDVDALKREIQGVASNEEQLKAELCEAKALNRRLMDQLQAERVESQNIRLRANQLVGSVQEANSKVLELSSLQEQLANAQRELHERDTMLSSEKQRLANVLEEKEAMFASFTEKIRQLEGKASDSKHAGVQTNLSMELITHNQFEVQLAPPLAECEEQLKMFGEANWRGSAYGKATAEDHGRKEQLDDIDMARRAAESDLEVDRDALATAERKAEYALAGMQAERTKVAQQQREIVRLQAECIRLRADLEERSRIATDRQKHADSKKLTRELEKTKGALAEAKDVADEFSELANEERAKAAQLGIEQARYHDNLRKAHKEVDMLHLKVAILEEDNRKLLNTLGDYVQSFMLSGMQVSSRGNGKFATASQPLQDMSCVSASSCEVHVGNDERAIAAIPHKLDDSEIKLQLMQEQLDRAEARNADLQFALAAAIAARDEVEKNAECINRSIDFFIQDIDEKRRIIDFLKQRCQSMQILQAVGTKCQPTLQRTGERPSLNPEQENLMEVDVTDIAVTRPESVVDDSIDKTVKVTVDKAAENMLALHRRVAKYEKEIETLLAEKQKMLSTIKVYQHRLQEAQQFAMKYRREVSHHRKYVRQIEKLVLATVTSKST